MNLRAGSFGYEDKANSSRPKRCEVWIIERMRYPTDQPTDTASYRGALSHLKKGRKKRKKKKEKERVGKKNCKSV